jgi:glutamate N-acetyltransferase / amino-acid N-acetyltransferase
MTPLRRSPDTIRVPKGFSFSAMTVGIKASGRPDLALAVSEAPCAAAALFTKNRVVAAPVEVGREALRLTGGRIRAVLVNSGNANCATGAAGRKACEQVCREAARALGAHAEEVLPSSTGIIGVPFPANKVIAALPRLFDGCASTPAAAQAFAKAILTTDTRPKIATAEFGSGNSAVTVLGIAKGAGMIHPQMATMLVYLFADIGASPSELRRVLREACDPTLNSMSVDGDTSTNDTVLLMASGRSGVHLSYRSARNQFTRALSEVCQSLAEQIVTDGEGVKHVIQLFVEQARTREEALRAARAIAHSALVKTAWAGADPNWGRILAAVGYSGVAIDPARVNIFIGDKPVCRKGAAFPFDEKRAHRSLSQPECDIRVQLGRGSHSVRFLTTDLTAEYVKINADYST